MKILVFSDSHGRTSAMCDAVLRWKPDAVLHLGDGAEDLEEVRMLRPEASYCAVRGNCDLTSALPLREEVNMGGVSIFMTHGHLYRVKYELEPVLYAGSLSGAKIILFGHTHEPGWEYRENIFLLNPGSIGYRDTYALIEANNGEFAFSMQRRGEEKRLSFTR